MTVNTFTLLQNNYISNKCCYFLTLYSSHNSEKDYHSFHENAKGYITFGPLAVKKQNCMHFAEEHCFGCASALHVCAD